MTMNTRERPATFNAQSVRAILDGTKTEHRWPVRPQPELIAGYWRRGGAAVRDPRSMLAGRCPRGNPGDRMWVRETWSVPSFLDNMLPQDMQPTHPVAYAAGGERGLLDMEDSWGKTRSPDCMPRWASRITLDGPPSRRAEREQGR